MISWEVDLLGVDLVGVDFVRIDLVGGYQPDVRAVCLEILHSIVKRQTIVVAGTYGSVLLPFKLHVGYNKCSTKA